MSKVIEEASQELIAKLVRAGYLQPALRHDADAITTAIARLKEDHAILAVPFQGVTPLFEHDPADVSEKIEVPVIAPKLAVSDAFKADIFLQLDDLADAFVLDLAQTLCCDVLAFMLHAGLLQFGGTQ